MAILPATRQLRAAAHGCQSRKAAEGSAYGRAVRRAFSLQPHRVETFKLSTGPFFVEKVRDYRPA